MSDGLDRGVAKFQIRPQRHCRTTSHPSDGCLSTPVGPPAWRAWAAAENPGCARHARCGHPSQRQNHSFFSIRLISLSYLKSRDKKLNRHLPRRNPRASHARSNTSSNILFTLVFPISFLQTHRHNGLVLGRHHSRRPGRPSSRRKAQALCRGWCASCKLPQRSPRRLYCCVVYV